MSMYYNEQWHLWRLFNRVLCEGEPLINWHLSSEVFVKGNKFIWACRFRPETSTKRQLFEHLSNFECPLSLLEEPVLATWNLINPHLVVFIGYTRLCTYLVSSMVILLNLRLYALLYIYAINHKLFINSLCHTRNVI